MHFLYIIYSPTADKFFAGETNNVPRRIELHNNYKKMKGFTGAASDWELKLIFNCASREEAVYLQKFLTRMKSREFFEKIIEHPESLTDLLRDLKNTRLK